MKKCQKYLVTQDYINILVAFIAFLKLNLLSMNYRFQVSMYGNFPYKCQSFIPRNFIVS